MGGIFKFVENKYIKNQIGNVHTKGIPVDNQNFLQTLPLFADTALQDDLVVLDSVCGIYTKEELEFYFTSFARLINSLSPFAGIEVLDKSCFRVYALSD